MNISIMRGGLLIYNYQALEKLKRHLDEAEAAVEERKKPLPETGPRVVGEGLVIDEWVIYRLRSLACSFFFSCFLSSMVFFY